MQPMQGRGRGGLSRGSRKHLQSTSILEPTVGPSLQPALLGRGVFAASSVDLEFSWKKGHFCFLEIFLQSISCRVKAILNLKQSINYLNNMYILIKLFYLLDENVLCQNQTYWVKRMEDPFCKMFPTHIVAQRLTAVVAAMDLLIEGQISETGGRCCLALALILVFIKQTMSFRKL